MGLAIISGVLTIIGIVAYIVSIKRRPSKQYGITDWEMSIWNNKSSGLLALFSVSIAGAVGFFLSIIPDSANWLPYQCVQSNSQSLQLLRDSSGTQGRFYLGSGYINSYLAYYYFIRNSDGGIVGGSISASDVTVYQDDAKNPRIESYNYQLIGVARLLFTPVQSCTHIIHIPPGSVQQGYNLG